MQKIAIIGTGITGLGAAWLLNHNNLNITVFESDTRIGGHANTVASDNHAPVDTGFIVFNQWTYPNMMTLFDMLDIPYIPSNMGFAVSAQNSQLEYSSDAIFAQRKNLLKPSFYSMLCDLVRFYRQVPKDVYSLPDNLTLGDYLMRNNYGSSFIDDHLIPMGAAIWSMDEKNMLSFPMKSFANFCINHGLLNLLKRPQWYTVDGGSRSYVDKLSEGFRDKIRLNTPVTSIKRSKGYVYVNDEQFDKALICTHPDQSLEMLDDPSNNEENVLAAIPYSTNKAILHRDASQMPRTKKAWAAWNYIKDSSNQLTLTYWMNRLQGFLPEDDDLFVTLNPKRPIKPELILHEETYHHPVYSLEAIKAQSQIKTIQGKLNTWYAGAWCGYGFHEDGLSAGLAIAETAGNVKRPWQIKEKSSAAGNTI